jgi:hypothetical protein
MSSPLIKDLPYAARLDRAVTWSLDNFNLRHASLRNVIERIFGVIKRKFKILSQMAEYSIDTQVALIPALCSLYNFIRQYEGDKVEDIELEEEAEEDVEDLKAIDIRGSGNKYMNEKREEIAQQMWKDYQEYINNKN